jgi:hypothetical protein
MVAGVIFGVFIFAGFVGQVGHVDGFFGGSGGQLIFESLQIGTVLVVFVQSCEGVLEVGLAHEFVFFWYFVVDVPLQPIRGVV